MKEFVRSALIHAHERGVADGLLSPTLPPFIVQVPAHEEHGDFASNIAMVLAKPERKSPREIASILLSRIQRDDFGKVEIAGPGFINLTLSPAAWQESLRRISRDGEGYGRSRVGEGTRVQVEFVSANPTGPLHVGHGRGAAIGDVICRLLEAVGYSVTREFYYNDAGQQIENLARSVQARALGNGPDHPDWPVDGYQGEYIIDVARAYVSRETVTTGEGSVTASGNPHDLDDIRRFSVAFLRREQDQDLRAFDVRFDVYFLESSLYADGKVEAVVQRLTERGMTYEKDGAIWLRTTLFGDDKDRVMRKSDGSYTYFVPDVAYHLDKWERGFTRVINEQGADHHSTVTRVRAGLQALDRGIPQGWPEYVLHQMVTVMRGGEEVKISKRAGSYVTLRDLIDEVGRDATRYFFVMRKPDSQLTFDIDLAKERSLDNPVYYVQYAHARIHGIYGTAWDRGIIIDDTVDLSPLTNRDELTLIKLINQFPETVLSAAEAFEPHRICGYLQNLAAEFHGFYNRNRVVSDDSRLTAARLYLLRRVAQVIANGLSLLGVAAPERM
ncbi:MAG: arginine--tRNA ligase [Desulfuromonadia bacterium]